MKTGTNLGRAGSPLPAARPHDVCGAHGVTRPANVPTYNGNWYYVSREGGESQTHAFSEALTDIILEAAVTAPASLTQKRFW
ncbi:MAG: hypothetical protein ABSD29_18040 [Verrucomicrobiota bacterium]